MTVEEKREFEEMKAEKERLEKENVRVKADQVKLSESNRLTKIEAQKAVWLAEGIAPATIATAEKFLKGQVKDGVIHLSEGKEVDLVDAFAEVFKGFEKIDLSENGQRRRAGAGEIDLEEVAKELK